ncbi:MAG: tripartite tricarboxylate transporter substrate-binding protein [Casimicrobiaceae bacterium]
MAAIPEVPTLSEAGLPGFAAYGWNAILAPKGTPRAIVDKLNREINAVIASPEVQARFAELGLDVLEPTTPESAAAFITAETSKWAPVIRAAGGAGILFRAGRTRPRRARGAAAGERQGVLRER